MQRRCAGLAGVLLGLLGPGCAGPAWDAEALEAAHPALARYPGHRLADLHPYLWPRQGELLLFTCRWTTEAPLGVWISAEFDARERSLAERALEAWQQAGLGLRFAEVREDEAAILLSMTDAAIETATGPGAGRAVVDCALADELPGARTMLGAELVLARVEVARSVTDPLGRRRVREEAELLGTLVHELGHALGFQGHVSYGNRSALRRAPEEVRALGERLLAGSGFADDSLSALYALPSGTLLARVAVEGWRTSLVDRMAALARSEGLEGPFARVGDRTARIFWRDHRGGRADEYGLQVMNLAETLRRPERLLVGAETLTRAALPRSRDQGPGR